MNVIPSLPTDNLYKWLALAGVALVITVVVVDETELRRSKTAENTYWDKKRAFEIAESVMEREEKGWKDANEQFHKFVDEKDLEKAKAQIAEVLQENQEYIAAVDERNRQWREALHAVEKWQEHGPLPTLISTILMFIGLLSSGVGFTLWYNLGQKHHDAILKAEATLRLLEVERLTKREKKMVVIGD